MVGEKLIESHVRLVKSLPSLGQTPLGAMFYNLTNDKLYIRLVTGWKYIDTDG